MPFNRVRLPPFRCGYFAVQTWLNKRFLQTKIDLSEEMIEKVKNSFGKGPFTTKVKMLIRRCIRANLKEVHTKRISMARGRYLLERTVEIAHKNDGLPDGLEKYQQMLKGRRYALGALVNQLNKEGR